MSEIILTPEYERALDLLDQGKSFFVHGRAGTGKSTLLRMIVERCPYAVVTAPTGIAALNVGGWTLHGTFWLPFGVEPPTAKVERINFRLLRRLKLLIIDEVSMVRSDVMAGIDRRLRYVFSNDKPFGGVQVVLFGDMLQLEPVVKEEEAGLIRQWYGGPLFFEGPNGALFDMPIIELTRVFRQADGGFASLLNRVRVDRLQPTDLATINGRVGRGDEGSIVLTATRAAAADINLDALKRLDGIVKREATYTGECAPSDFKAEQTLMLAPGLRVMTIQNDKQKRFVNGSLGSVVDIEGDCVTVALDDGEEVGITPWAFEKTKPGVDIDGEIRAKVVASCQQWPLVPAHAITIHKSQGQSFDACHIDMGNGAFAAGQTYVALSRCRSLEGMTLARELLPCDIMAPRALTFLGKDYE